MPLTERSELQKTITRRVALGAAGALAAAPALAQECQIGPPLHAKGPVVWMDMDKVELDAAYDQAFYAPLGRQIIARLAAASEAARSRLGQPQRETYGETAAEKLDIYRTRRAKAPIFVFIHGGAWLGGEAKNYAFPAEMIVNAGAHYVAPDFIAIREAGGDLAVMADQVRRAIAWVYRNADKLDGDRDRFYVGGHSSGGHLCGIALVTDWQKDFGLPADMIKGGRRGWAQPSRGAKSGVMVAICASGVSDPGFRARAARTRAARFNPGYAAPASARRC